MNTFKKIGLTALAGSLVVTSAYAGSMSVSGGASIGLKNTTKTATGKSWTMGNQLTFSGSGELDNGMNVSLSFVLDQADDSTTGIANAPFDSHSVTISSDDLGTLVFFAIHLCFPVLEFASLVEYADNMNGSYFAIL